MKNLRNQTSSISSVEQLTDFKHTINQKDTSDQSSTPLETLVSSLRAQLSVIMDLAERQIDTTSLAREVPGHTLKDILVSQRQHFTHLVDLFSNQLQDEQVKFNHILQASQASQSRLREEVAILHDSFISINSVLPFQASILPPKEPGLKRTRVRSPTKPPVPLQPRRRNLEVLVTDREFQELAQVQQKLQQQVIALQDMTTLNDSEKKSGKRSARPDPVVKAVTSKLSYGPS